MKDKVTLAVAALALLTVLPVYADHHCSHQQVRLHIPANEIKVTPQQAPKCVFKEVGQEGGFAIAITPPGSAVAGSATVVEKDGVPLEIRGNNNDDPDTISVTVTGDAGPNGPYGYIVRVEGHGELDPEVRIVTSRMLMLNSLMDQVDALLEEEMGFGLMKLNEKQRELEDRSNMQKQAD